MEEKRETLETLTARTTAFLQHMGISELVASDCNDKDYYSNLVRGLLIKPHLIQRGRLTCLLLVKPAVTNFFGSLHGGAVASVAEFVSIACARTVVGEDKELFLGELSISYLSSAPKNAEVVIDASVVKAGRNLTVVSMDFKLKTTGKLVYTARSTFYNTPIAKYAEKYNKKSN